MESTVLKTSCQMERESRDLALYLEYEELMSVEGQSKTRVNEHLMKKFGLHSVATVYTIRKRVAKRLGKEVDL